MQDNTQAGKSTLRTQKSREWAKGTKLGDMARKIAKEHGMAPAVMDTLAKIALPHIDQADESDLHFLGRVVKKYDGIVKPAAGKLVLATDAVYEAFLDDDTARGFLHSHSYTGNPLACRAALATLELFERKPVFANNRAIGERIWQGLQALATHPQVRHLRQRGMIFAFDVALDDTAQANAFARRFASTALQHELLLRPIGQTVYYMLPYILSEAEAELLTTRTRLVLDEVLVA